MDNIDKLLYLINSCENPSLVLRALIALVEPSVNERDDVREERAVRNERRIKRLRYQAYLDKLTRIYNERREHT